MVQTNRLKCVAAAVSTRGGAAAVQLLLSVVLGRLVGPSGLGVFLVFLAGTYIAGAFAAVGLPVFTLRRTASLVALNEVKKARSFWMGGLGVVALASAATALLIYGLRHPLSQFWHGDASPQHVVALAAIATIPFVILTYCCETLKGLGRPQLGLGLQFGGAPAFTLVVLPVWLALSGDAAPSVVINLYTAGLAFSSIAAASLVLNGFGARQRPTDLQSGGGTLPDGLRLSRTTHFWASALLTQLMANAPFVILPFVVTPDQVGLFGAANRLVSLAALILVAIAGVYSPMLAAAHVRGDGRRLHKLLRETQLYSIVLYLPMLVVLIVGKDLVLGLFGVEFGAAAPLLVVLAIGHLVNSCTGTVTQFNLMTNGESVEVGVTILALGIVCLIAFILSEPLGTLGVAFAVAVSSAAKNAMSYVRAIRTAQSVVPNGSLDA